MNKPFLAFKFSPASVQDIHGFNLLNIIETEKNKGSFVVKRTADHCRYWAGFT